MELKQHSSTTKALKKLREEIRKFLETKKGGISVTLQVVMRPVLKGNS